MRRPEGTAATPRRWPPSTAMDRDDLRGGRSAASSSTRPGWRSGPGPGPPLRQPGRPARRHGRRSRGSAPRPDVLGLLLNAHPELAGREARARPDDERSPVSEQGSAGLDRHERGGVRPIRPPQRGLPRPLRLPLHHRRARTRAAPPSWRSSSARLDNRSSDAERDAALTRSRRSPACACARRFAASP